MSLNISELENFVLTAEHGSLSRAATIAGIAQPALGRQIQKIEAECGCRLFYRHGRGVALTVEGERYLERVRPLVRQLRAAGLDLHQSESNIAGNVTVGMTPTVLEMLGMPLIDRMERDYPNVSLNVISGYSGYIHEWLVDGRLDVAILHDAKRSRHISFDPLASAALYLVSSPASLAQAEQERTEISIEELGSYPLALPTRGHGLRRTLEYAASEVDVKLNVAYEIDTLPLMKRLVVEKRAHSVLALPAVLADVIGNTLIARRINPQLCTALGLATASNRPVSRAIQTVLMVVREELKATVLKSPQELGIVVN